MRRAGMRGRGALPVCALLAGTLLAGTLLVAGCGAGAVPGGPMSPMGDCAVAYAAEGADGGGAEAVAEDLLPAGLDPSTARRTTIARLSSASAALDNMLVTFRGEAVGEPVRASSSGYRWVLLQSHVDGVTSSIEVLMTVEQVARIENFGSYQVKGSTVEVTGIYRVADPNQTGSLDVTAYRVSVVDAGGAQEDEADLPRLWAGAALAVVGLALSGAGIYLKRRSRA